MISSSGVAVSVETSPDVCHDKGCKNTFKEDLRLSTSSFKLLFLGDSFLGIPPHLSNDARRSQLRVDVEDAGEPGDLLPLVDPVPGEPRCEVVQEEGDKQHRRPDCVGLVLQFLLRNFSETG